MPETFHAPNRGDELSGIEAERVDPIALTRRLASSDRLRQRRFELLPLTGPTAVFTEVQGRAPGDSTTTEGLGELISSIATVGVLQPVLVEELRGGAAHRLVSGERRLRACRRGAVLDPTNPHFHAIPAVICPGPLSEGERRTWQLVENLAREDLQPGELAAALMFERCALMTVKLLRAGVPVPMQVMELEDPLERFRTLEKLRVGAGEHALGAPWAEVLSRLGIRLGPERARQLVRAFSTLPPELSDQMDEAQVSLATRMEFLRLRRGREGAAEELWAAVRARRKPELLAAAVAESLEHPALEADSAIERAQDKHEAANASRSETLRARAAEARRSADPFAGSLDGDTARALDDTTTAEDELTPAAAAPATVHSDVLGSALTALRGLLTALRSGGALLRYDAGSIRLLASEVLTALGTEETG